MMSARLVWHLARMAHIVRTLQGDTCVKVRFYKIIVMVD